MIQHKIDDYAVRDLNCCRFILPKYTHSYKPFKAFQELLYLEGGDPVGKKGRVEDCLNMVCGC